MLFDEHKKIWATDYFAMHEIIRDAWAKVPEFDPELTERMLTLERSLYAIAKSAYKHGARMFRVEGEALDKAR